MRYLPICISVYLFFSANNICYTQCWNLVWEEEFTGAALDLDSWEYQTGGGGWGNNELQYYTSGNNITLSNGILKITADEDTANEYPDNDYTSSRIRTRYKKDWRYGKMEANIKLPFGQGIWPAFWMMPTNDVYGTWPSSGEIDIMEYLGHQTSTLYGTCHYGNSPVDKGSTGGSTNLGTGIFPDNFHTFSIEWEPSQIRWYLDGTQYLVVNDTDPDFLTYNWPFDQEFHFILNLAVGGNWPGAPNGTTVFPQVMEVDWVRVYQLLTDIEIEGELLVEPSSTGEIYTMPDIAGATYNWSVPAGATIVSGQNTNQITMDWGNNSGTVSADITTGCGIETLSLAVAVSPNLWLNYDFEDDYSFWDRREFNGADADFDLITTNVQEGAISACVTTQVLASNPWDIQLGRSGIDLESGEDYTVSFWAKADQTGKDASIAFINSSTFAWYAGTNFVLTDSWAYYSYSFTASTTALSLFNIDLGDELGTFCFDDFTFGRTFFLPVGYSDFWLNVEKNNVIKLHWTTQLEAQLDYFEVQKSQDLTNWKSFKKITAKGQANHYQTQDNNPSIGQNYYRIKSVDYDGSVSYTSVLNAEISKPLVNIYPNPTKQHLIIESQNIGLIQIFNVDGRLLMKKELPLFADKYILDLAGIENGTYILKVVGDGFLEIKEFVKIR